MATHSSGLAWRIPGTWEPGGLLSVGSHRVGHDWSDLAAYIWKVLVHVLLKPSLKDIQHNLASMWNEWNWTIAQIFSFASPFFGIGMKTDLFQSCSHCWVFQVCWHIECSTLTASSFRILNSSAGIPSPLLALFIVVLPKIHLTSHSRMSGSRWVTVPSWLSGSRPFLYSSYVYSGYLFLISSASVTISGLYRAHSCMKCSLDISSFLEEISSLSHSVVFLYLFALFI